MSKSTAKSKKSPPPSTTTTTQTAEPSSLSYGFAEIILSIFPLALYLFAYERTLVPIYASVPTKYLLKKAFIASLGLAALVPVKLSKTKLLVGLSVLLAAAPKATYWVAVVTARRHEPIYGPAVTHLVTLAPVAYLVAGVASNIGLARSQDESSSRPIAAILCSVAASSFLQSVIARIPLINHVTNSEIFIFLSWLSSTLALTTYIQRPATQTSKKSSFGFSTFALATSVGLFAALYTLLKSPALPSPLKDPYIRPDFPILIHSSVQSVTGLIAVAEALPPPEFDGAPDEEMHSVRWIRADHSILGGVWLGAKIGVLDDTPPLEDAFGVPLGDSIYSTFVLQEAVRMALSDLTSNSGLGAGISTTAFQRHGVSTTIVEIDPAVYEAARTYFGLPDPGPGKVFLEDARGWVEQRRSQIAAQSEPELFDFIVHDCFSGGGVPQHIFTVEFWGALKSLMHPDGVLVVNFAGQPKSPAATSITLTLEKVFGHCRAFHDSMEMLPVEKYESEFINVVFFCAAQPVTFRNARTSDYLGSPLRQHVLKSVTSREIDLNVVKGAAANDTRLAASLVLRDAHNDLGKWQDKEAFHHWTLMREVLKDIFWETY
ncbi:hypothetical protein ONZ45_g7235 [Pleurotus djamor]|nr:hypothetical protein ONZ45_g7235 [Pleurotus djamor]